MSHQDPLLEPVFSQPPTQDAPVSRPNWRAFLGYVILLLLIPIGFALGGEAASFAQIGIFYIAFMVLASLAYAGQNRVPARVLVLLWLGILLLVSSLFTVSFAAIAGGLSGLPGLDIPGQELPSNLLTNLAQVGLGILAALVIAGLGFLPALRRLLAGFLPLEAASFVHMIALVAVVGITLVAIVPLVVLGVPPLLSPGFSQLLAQTEVSDASGLLSQTYTLLWAIPVSVFAVGYGIRRSLAASLARLGLVRATVRQIGIGAGVAVLLVIGVNVLEFGLDWFWSLQGWARTDAEAFGELMAFAFSPLGAVVIGVTAGLGEELAVRGVLQPRLGILLSNLFFTSLHAFQYNWDALLVVFLLGMLFGILRNRTNTTTSALAHGLYDFILVMMAVYEIQLF